MNMKKNYNAPLVEAVSMIANQTVLAGSPADLGTSYTPAGGDTPGGGISVGGN